MLDFPASPSTGQAYGQWLWDGVKWTQGNVTASTWPYTDTGRNLIHNGLFNVAQRGAGGFSTTGYTLDRWGSYFVNGSQVINQVALSDANRTSIGDEAAAFGIQANITGSATAGSLNQLYQCIEDVRRLAGKTVILSFWGWNSTGALRIGASVYQAFGSGGSPSANVPVAGQSVMTSATPTRYSLTFSLPSIAGKTLGTNSNTSFTGLNLYFSGATDQNTTNGNVGVQTGFFYLWGAQLEIGSVATPLDYGGSYADQLRACQRYYQAGQVSFGGYGTAATTINCWNSLNTAMRAIPTLAIATPSYTNASNLLADQANLSGFRYYATVTATGMAYISGAWTASADL